MRPTLHPRTISSYLNDATILEFLERSLPRLSGTVLDIGCGTMRYKPTVLSAPGVERYVGLDLEAGRFAYSVPADAYWDGVRMPFEDGSIDGALLFEVLEHCADPRLVVGEAARVLKPGGALLFSTPFVYPLHGVPYDFQRLTPFGARQLMSAAGFAPIEIEAGGAWDASLGQAMSLWISHRPMPRLLRMALAVVHVPVFQVLLALDRGQRRAPLERENRMLTGILGVARKPA